MPRTVRWLVAGGAALALLYAGRTFGGELPRLIERVQTLGPWGPLVFVVIYAVAVVAFAPGSALTFSAGAIFGLPRGVALAFTGAALGATAAFVIARTVGRRAVERRVAGDARIAAIDRAIATRGRRIVFLLRLSPAVPFNLLNYALGLTRVRVVDYLIALPGMLPATVLYVYSGKVAGDVATAAGGAAVERGAGYYAVLGLGLAATVAVTVVVTRLARHALAEATREQAGATRADTGAHAASTGRPPS
jgi:uncharacterized membrane protein YdjX (TVP38/TMEM64 family)